MQLYFTIHVIDPGRGTLKLVVERGLDCRNLISIVSHVSGALPGLYPYAGHLRLDLAMPVHQNTPAWAITQSLGTGHGTGHAGAVQYTMPTHAAIEEGYFADNLQVNKNPFSPSTRDQPTLKWSKHSFKGMIGDF
jgi:hypothetical protein